MGQHLAQAQAHLSASSEVMADLISRFVPPPIDPKPPELYFDVLVSSIIGQQLSVKAADTIEARLRTLAGEMNPQRILELDPPEMREQGLSYSKISYLHALADAFHQGSLEPHALKTMPEADITASLTAVKGIGLWTAEMFMIFGMGRPDIWSPGDLGFGKHCGLCLAKMLTSPKRVTTGRLTGRMHPSIYGSFGMKDPRLPRQPLREPPPTSRIQRTIGSDQFSDPVVQSGG